jgi:hypothetical protein
MLDDVSHLHWCPRCEAIVTCASPLALCTLGRAEVLPDHCDRPERDDDVE